MGAGKFAWKRFAIYLTLCANGIVFFHKPLFSRGYSFPWDFRAVQLPLVSFLAEELSKGRFALWDPFTYCGNPIFANIQASFFHPLVFLAAFLSAQTSLDALPMLLEWAVVLQVCFAAAVSFHVFRQFDLRTPAAWAGAVIFETGGYFASRAEHMGTLMAVSWIPLALLAVLKMRVRYEIQWLGTLGLALGMAVLGGLPQATLAVFLAVLLLAVLLVILRMARAGVIGNAIAGIALGIGLASIIFIPAAQLTRHSVAQYRSGWLGTGGGLYWQSFASLVWPDTYHIFDLSKFKGPWDPSFLYLYGSLAGLFLAAFAVLYVRTRAVALFGLMGLSGAVLMLGDKTAVWRLAYPLLPETIRIGIHPEYTYCIFTFAMAGLAAIGLNSVKAPDAARWIVAIGIALDLFFAGSNRPMNCTNLAVEPGLTRHSFDGSEALLNEVRRYAARDFPPARIDTLDAGIGDASIGDASIRWVESATLTRVPTASGASPLALEDIIQLRLLLHEGSRWGWYYPVVNVNSPALDLMNVKYLLVSRGGAARLANVRRFGHVASLPSTEVFENRSVIPRCFTVGRVRKISSPEEGRRLIEQGQVDLRQTALVYDALALPEPQSGAPPRVEITHYEPDLVKVQVDTTISTFVVLSDAFYPGWTASIDGKVAPIHLTDIAFRGVVIPPGSHRIVMSFRPKILYVSGIVSAGFLLGICSLIVIGRKRQLTLRHTNVAETAPLSS